MGGGVIASGHSTVRQQARHLEKVKGLRSGWKPFPVREQETVGILGVKTWMKKSKWGI